MKFKVGDTAEISKTISESDVYGFAEICGDFNPLHVNAEVAKNSRFGQRVCQGMLVASFVSTVLGMYLPGPGTIYLKQNSTFVAPVFIGDTITAKVTVSNIKDNGVITLKTVVINQHGQKVVIGQAKVII